MLNRVVRWLDTALELEADPRQIEKLVAECGLEGAKSVGTPGTKHTFQDLEGELPLKESLHTPFRGQQPAQTTLPLTAQTCSLRLKKSADGWRVQ